MFTNRSYIFLLPALVALFAVACQESAYINGPGQNIFNQDSIVPIVEPEPMPDPEGVDIPEGTLDVVQACDTCAKLAVGDTTKTKYYVKGWIVAIDEGNATAIEKHGNAIFTIATTTDERAKRFIAYQVKGKNGEEINRQEMVQLGDFVVIYGELMNFNGTAETVGRGAAYIYASNNPEFNKVIPDPEPTPAPEGFVIPEGALNVYQVRDSCAKLASGAVSKQKYYIYGWVKSFNESKHLDGIQKYGNAFFYMTATDDPNAQKDFYAFRCMGKLGAKIPDATVMQEGDFVLISAYITNYNGTTYETTSGACIVSSTNAAFNDAFYDFKGSPEPDRAVGQISVTEAEAICRTLANQATTNDTYDVVGVVNSVDEAANPSFGNATFRITDGKSFIIAYRCKGMDGAKFTNANQVQLGDTVVVTGKLQNFYDTPEVSNGYLSDSTNPNL